MGTLQSILTARHRVSHIPQQEYARFSMLHSKQASVISNYEVELRLRWTVADEGALGPSCTGHCREGETMGLTKKKRQQDRTLKRPETKCLSIWFSLPKIY